MIRCRRRAEAVHERREIKLSIGSSWKYIALSFLWTVLPGCAIFGHYPVNEPLKKYEPGYGYWAKNLSSRDNSEDLLLILTFSGGGTRAAAFSYGVLEELRATEVTLDNRKRSLLDQVDSISAVSGGSFTAAYYGLFGDRIFKDFESLFLKKDIQGALTANILFNPLNWFRLSSPFFDRSDLAGEYFDKNIFEGGTFGDLGKRKGPMVFINATDMSKGTRLTFHQPVFDILCSDLSSFPVGRACAASAAVPGLLSPITLRNYAGTCGHPASSKYDKSGRDYRHRAFKENLLELLNSEEKPYLHLIDGGVADNLGLRTTLESVSGVGDMWTALKLGGKEKVRKIAFIVVNAEKKIDDHWDKIEYVPPFSAMLSNYSSIAIRRYNQETVALLFESFERWSREIREGRCPPGQSSTAPGSCGDISFYLAEVKFEDIEDPEERSYLNKLPTSFRLEPEDVDKLKNAARHLLRKSEDFQKLLRDLEK